MSGTARVDFRVDLGTKALIKRAAMLNGETLSDFAKGVLVRKARHVVREREQTVLTDRDRDIFLALLDSKAKPNAALRRAANLYRRASMDRTTGGHCFAGS